MDEDIKSAVQDPDRLQTLRETGLLDSEVEEQFDRLTRLASRLLRVPATFFSLVDEDRDFYKSCFGFDESLASEREISGTTFCHYSMVSEGALVIPDTRADPVYRDVPTVKSLGVAAYLGVPVRATNGQVLGSFCAIDMQPHDWSELEVETMTELAKSAEREISVRDRMRRQEQLMVQELEAREELERVMDSRARLMRGFTHDVKNPLGAADGFLTLLQSEVYGPLSEPQQDALERARRSIATALSLIDDLVQLARAEAGQLEIARGPVDLAVVAREITGEYRAQAEGRGLRLQYRERDDLPLIHSDRDRIRQVLSNLISNAVKYTPEGGILVEVCSRERSDGDGDGTRIWSVVDVTDTGPGIPQDKLHVLFEEFTRLHTGPTEGTGLGLSIAKRLAEALQGSITVQSDVGRGSTFTLWLPTPGPSHAAESGEPRQHA